MTRLFTDGAEMGDVLPFNSAYHSVSTSIKRSGLYSYYGSLWGIGNIGSPVFIDDKSEIYIKCAFYIDTTDKDGANGIWVGYESSTPIMSVGCKYLDFITASVNNVVVDSSSIFTPIKEWFLLECYFKMADSTDGKIIVKFNGIEIINYIGDTKPSTSAVFDRVYFGMISGATYIGGQYLDDIAINDTSGSVDNSWCGDGHVIALVPDGVGDASELTPSSGSVNYLMVDATPYNTTDYVESSTPDAKDLYNLASSGLVSGSHIISRVFAEVIALDTTTGSGAIATVFQSGSSVVEETSQNLSTAYGSYKGTDNYLNPATGLAWTVDELDALQVGVVVKA